MPTTKEVSLDGTQPRPLARIRLEQGMSRRVLARRAGCSPVTIYGAETGRRVPIPQTARKLSVALGVQLMDVAEFRSAMAEWAPRARRDQRNSVTS
jgi:transcriptional regulator with XRE-family HTH domain